MHHSCCHIYKTTGYIATHINKYTNNRTLRSTNKLTLNTPEFSQTIPRTNLLYYRTLFLLFF